MMPIVHLTPEHLGPFKGASATLFQPLDLLPYKRASKIRSTWCQRVAAEHLSLEIMCPNLLIPNGKYEKRTSGCCLILKLWSFLVMTPGHAVMAALYAMTFRCNFCSRSSLNKDIAGLVREFLGTPSSCQFHRFKLLSKERQSSTFLVLDTANQAWACNQKTHCGRIILLCCTSICHSLFQNTSMRIAIPGCCHCCAFSQTLMQAP